MHHIRPELDELLIDPDSDREFKLSVDLMTLKPGC